VPGPGRLAALLSAPLAAKALAAPSLKPGRGRLSYAHLSRKLTGDGQFQLTLAPSAAGRRWLKAVTAARTGHKKTKVLLRLQAVFTPTDGLPRSVKSAGIVIPT
jgi:hypothetical protein